MLVLQEDQQSMTRRYSQVITVGLSLPVNSFSLEVSRARSMIGFNASWASRPCFDSSWLYCSIYNLHSSLPFERIWIKFNTAATFVDAVNCHCQSCNNICACAACCVVNAAWAERIKIAIIQLTLCGFWWVASDYDPHHLQMTWINLGLMTSLDVLRRQSFDRLWLSSLRATHSYGREAPMNEILGKHVHLKGRAQALINF